MSHPEETPLICWCFSMRNVKCLGAAIACNSVGHTWCPLMKSFSLWELEPTTLQRLGFQERKPQVPQSRSLEVTLSRAIPISTRCFPDPCTLIPGDSAPYNGHDFRWNS